MVGRESCDGRHILGFQLREILREVSRVFAQEIDRKNPTIREGGTSRRAYPALAYARAFANRIRYWDRTMFSYRRGNIRHQSRSSYNVCLTRVLLFLLILTVISGVGVCHISPFFPQMKRGMYNALT
jgi:hypothetical protein